MNKVKFLLTIMFTLGILYACNNNDDQEEVMTENKQNNQTDEITEEIENNTALQADETMDPDQTVADKTQNGGLSSKFTNFDLDVEYKNDISFDVEYTNNQNKVTAEIEDEINNVHLQGDEANKRLMEAFELLNFEENTNDEEVRSQVLEAFNLDENFKEFELEIKFETGEVKKYNFNNNSGQ
ncbi:YusW family protein [Lysinibacillus telephonicus]|uniref:YusW-like protein n=1 Tax=Lysinibacillus telephonicus TaxID=1714840 RepID=A0A3S0HJU3_9BACI|nr:YusW family protein [Lysinibacillus telephonicus]RTQ93884.1 hypothetical protein EKG35_07120 [Lysinibacillus telephonicus]